MCIMPRIHSGWVDPDTPDEFRLTKALTQGDNREFSLVFSDEFETEGRSLKDGEDPRWTALDKNDYTNDALHFYNSDNVRTEDGMLKILTNLKDNDYKAFDEDTKKFYTDTKHVQSGMVQGWNKFCMTGGIVEISAKLPGKSSVGGYWPALWLLGNLARATFTGSSDWVWPFSYDACDSNVIYQQEVNACRKVGHYGMAPGVGRGAPEIDILEAMGGDPGKLPNTPIQRPYVSSSLQVAPGVSKNRPILMHQPKSGHWYEGLEYGNETSLNPFFYGVTLVHTPKDYTYQSDAISANTQASEDHYQKQNIYRIEWEPSEADGSGGYIKWFLNDKFLYGITGENLNITGAKIPTEPMYLLINTAVASSWGFPTPCPEGCSCDCFECGNSDCDCALPTGYCDNFPGSFEIEYVRVWQDVHSDKHETGCSTQKSPTDLFIKAHKKRYTSEFQKEPLLDISRGGAKCMTHDDCGSLSNGKCSEKGACVCNKGFIGSECLSHDAFDENPFNSQQSRIKVSTIQLSNGFMISYGLLVIGFMATLLFVVSRRNRGKGSTYTAIPNGDYAIDARVILNQQKQQGAQRSYCMIDGRLID